MNARQRIQEALKGIMSEGEANACRIYKGSAYDGAVQRYGWYFERFNAQPTYLGNSLEDALAMIEQIGEARTEDI